MDLKKLTLGVFSILLSIGCLFGCGTSEEDNESKSNEDSTKHEENRKSF